MTNDNTNHERKYDWDLFDSFYDPKTNETDDLNGCEEMNTSQWHVAQVHVVRLVFGRHEHDQYTLDKLHVHTHHISYSHHSTKHHSIWPTSSLQLHNLVHGTVFHLLIRPPMLNLVLEQVWRAWPPFLRSWRLKQHDITSSFYYWHCCFKRKLKT